MVFRRSKVRTSPPQFAAPSASSQQSHRRRCLGALSAAQVTSGLRIDPSQQRDAHARNRNTRARRSHVVAAARNSQRRVRVVPARRVSRTTAVGRSGSCAARSGTGLDSGPCSPCTAATSRAVDANICPELVSHAKPGLHWRRLPQRAVSSPQLPWRFAIPEDPGPCRRCAAALSIAADAPTYISLGSHGRSGLRMRRSPRRAIPCGHRNGDSLSATDATNPAARRRGSTRPDRRMRRWNRVLLRATIDSRTGGVLSDVARAPTERHASVHRVKPDLASATSGSRHVGTFVPVERARIARQTWGAHRWRIGMRVLRSTISNV